MSDFITDHVNSIVNIYLSKLANAKDKTEFEAIVNTIPEPYRGKVMMTFLSQMTGGGNLYPQFEIHPYRSIDSMLTDLRQNGNIGKNWEAREWGTAGDLSYYREKGELLEDWIRLIKMFKTLASYVNTTPYSIKLFSDLSVSGNRFNNSSYLLEQVGQKLTIHTNCYYYREDLSKVKLEDETDKKSVLTQFATDNENMVQDLAHSYFSWNQTNYNCPSNELNDIYSECKSIASKQ